MDVYENRASTAKPLHHGDHFRSMDATASILSCLDLRDRMANCHEEISIRPSEKRLLSACHAGSTRHCVKRR